MALRECNAAHCSAADHELYELCKAADWPAGYPVVTRDENGICTCACSCMALGTPVAVVGGDRAIQDFAVGDRVLAAGRDLVWVEKEVKFSQGTTGKSRQPFTVFVEYGNRSIIVTPDHLFLMRDGKLKRADRLSVEDYLVSSDGTLVAITSLQVGEFYGGFHHIATSTEAPDAELSGHLILTNGIVSSDYSAQLFYQTEQSKVHLQPGQEEAPIVGSEAYRAKYGEPKVLAPKSKLGKTAVVATLPGEAENAFVPAAQTRLTIPAHAVPFISDEDAEEIKRRAPKRGFSDPHAQELTNYLVEHTRAFYPNVTYHVDWHDETVNAFAWVENGVRHVALLGGLIRTEALEFEGISLILAHELGHHYGGAPTYPQGLSCEGQADYYGANVIMRKLWFGSTYLDMMDPAIEQLGNFFGFVPAHVHAAVGEGAVAAAVGGGGDGGGGTGAAGGNGAGHGHAHGAGAGAGCSHPPGACRVQTYQAAVNLRPKPACAG